MTRKAKLKSTGEIIEVRVDMDYHGNTTWLDAATNTEYCPSELELIPEEPDKTTLTQRILAQFPDAVLRFELKRRAAERKAKEARVLRCRDCKYCGEGCCHKSSRYKTSVCFLKPKPQVGPDRYYATLLSRKACVNFEPK